MTSVFFSTTFQCLGHCFTMLGNPSSKELTILCSDYLSLTLIHNHLAICLWGLCYHPLWWPNSMAKVILEWQSWDCHTQPHEDCFWHAKPSVRDFCQSVTTLKSHLTRRANFPICQMNLIIVVCRPQGVLCGRNGFWYFTDLPVLVRKKWLAPFVSISEGRAG